MLKHQRGQGRADPAAARAPQLAFDLPVNGELRAMRFDRDADDRVELSLRRRRMAREGHRRAKAPPAPWCSAARSASSLFRSARKAGLTQRATQLADRRDLQVRHRLRFRPGRRRPLQRGGGPDLARTASWSAPARCWRPRSPSTASCTRGFRYARNGKPEYFTAAGPAAEEHLHPHADPLCAPELRASARAAIRCWAACACTRAWITPLAPARRSWPPATRGWSSSAGRAATATP